jgi:hypothetical protein
MNPVQFNNKKSLQITSQDIRNKIKTNISNIGSFNLVSKYYTFLNKKNVNNLKENNFLVSLSTFGKKYVLFVTQYNTKKYCIFINKKNDVMHVTQFRFSDDIFLGTLLDGELVKTNDDKWIYLINDIAYYKGENVITKNFSEREKMIENLLANEYDDNENDFHISKKQFFKYNYIRDLIDNYMNKLSYKCAGLYFKNTNNFSDNYLFIFPECRSDSKILNNYSEEMAEQMPVKKIQASSISKSVLTEPEENKKNISSVPSHIPIPSTSVKLEKTTCRFLIHPTHLPDIYELYCSNNNNSIEKYNYAGVPDMDASNFIKSLFTSNYNNHEDLNQKIEKNNAIYVECNYHKIFKKWVPYKKVDNMDSVNTINSVQIILDSL